MRLGLSVLHYKVFEPHQHCNGVRKGIHFPLLCAEQVKGCIALIISCIHISTIFHKSLVEDKCVCVCMCI